jgi:hypothetical protein
MSILIQFVQDNIELFSATLIAFVVLILSVVALIVVKGKIKKATSGM